MGAYAGPNLSESGLVLALDAASPKNYNLMEVEYLIVAGGGSGGIAEANPAGDGAGGGGGGGVLTNIGGNFLSISPNQSYTIIVGNGGANSSGGNSSAFGLTAFGGGKGGNVRNASVASGGSGGGAGGNCVQANRTGGAGTAGQGNRGGNDLASTGNCSLRGGRGGGGAGSAAIDAASAQGTSGGNGIVSYISGTETYYAGGGGGGRGASNGVGGAGGNGGGGSGSNGTASPVAGTNNTGGGGGGGASYSSGVPAPGQGANGGSGIVIVRYSGPQKAIGGTVTSVDGYTIHTFTTVGFSIFTPLVATNNSVILGLADFSGRNNFATASGPIYSSANGGSLVFDGTDDYVDISNSSIGNFGTNDFTVSCWSKPTVGSSGARGLVSKYNPHSPNGTGWFMFNIDGQIRVFITQDLVAPLEQSEIVVSVSSNVWYNFVMRRSSNKFSLFINGQLSTENTTTNIIDCSSSGPLRIGSGYSLGYYYSGNVSLTQIYNRALTAAEIQQNYNATKSRYGL